jgi:hypothetical protein
MVGGPALRHAAKEPFGSEGDPLAIGAQDLYLRAFPLMALG